MGRSAPSDRQRFDELYQCTHRDLLRYLLRRSAATGLGVGTAYRRFANKQQIIEALFE